MSFFDTLDKQKAPLSSRMRPRTIDEFIGQTHIVGKNSYFRKAFDEQRMFSLILYGPPGTGKTSLANIIAEEMGLERVCLNAVSAGVSDAREVIKNATQRLNIYGKKTLFLLDECHRWSRSQSDVVLGAIEEGEIIFIGSTTENPYINLTKAMLSRCRVLELHPLTNEEIIIGLKNAINNSDKGLAIYDLSYEEDVLIHIANICDGDLRVALDTLEHAVLSTIPQSNGKIVLTTQIFEKLGKKDKIVLNSDDYYLLLSAFCKSLRGSDPDAALFYANKLILSGCDPLVIARRLVIHSSEDVGLAQSNALLISMSALNSIEKIGMPECMLTLSHAILYVALCPKSNSVASALYLANEAAKDINNKSVPQYLSNHFKAGLPMENQYKFPHDYGGWVKQQYLPDEIADSMFYNPSQNGEEKVIIDNMNKFKRSTNNEKTD